MKTSNRFPWPQIGCIGPVGRNVHFTTKSKLGVEDLTDNLNVI